MGKGLGPGLEVIFVLVSSYLIACLHPQGRPGNVALLGPRVESVHSLCSTTNELLLYLPITTTLEWL